MKEKIKQILREELDERILYSAVVLDEESKDLLFDIFDEYIPQKWRKIGHHMTISFGSGVDNKDDIGKEVRLYVTQIGVSDMAIAARVEGYPSKNQIPHVTLAINPEGGKPVMSNFITDWVDVIPFVIYGVVTEIKKY